MKMPGALARLGLIIAAGVGVLATGHVNAAIRQTSDDAKTDYHAFIVGGVDPRDTQDHARIEATLRSRYGFNSVRSLLGREATAGNIIEGLDDFLDKHEEGDSLVIMLLLPISQPQSGIEALLITADPNTQFGRDGGMPLFMVVKALSRARYHQLLLVTPDCSDTFESRSLASELAYSASSRNSELTLLSFCPPLPSNKLQFTVPTLPADLGDALDSVITLAQPSADDLVRLLREKMHDNTRLSLNYIAPSTQTGFRFYVSSKTAARELEASVQRAQTEEQWSATISLLTQAARANAADAPTSEEAIKQLKKIALNKVDGKRIVSSSRQHAVRSLGTLPPTLSLDPLRAALKNEDDPFVRLAALSELGRIGGESGLEAIEGAVHDKDAEVQQSAIRTLSLRRSAGGAEEIARLIDNGTRPATMAVALRALAAFSRPEDAARFAHFLPDSNDEVRTEALRALRPPLAPDVKQRVIHLLRSDRSDRVRREAAYALGRGATADAAIGAELLQAATRGPEDVTVAALWAMGPLHVDSPEAVDILCTALSSGSDRVREAAIGTFGEIKSDRCLDALDALVRDTQQPNATRIAAIETITNIGAPSSIKVLTSVQSDADSDVARTAAEALGTLSTGDLALERLKHPSDVVRAQAAEQFGKKPDPRAVEPLIGALIDPSALVKGAAANSLVMYSDEATQARLLDLIISSRSPAQRSGAAFALRGRDFNAVSAALFQAATDTNVPVRQTVAQTLSTYQLEPAAVECLRALAKDPSPAVRLPALETITRGRKVKPGSPGESAMACKPVPLLSWDINKGQRYYAFSMQLVTSDKREPIKLQYPTTSGITFDGKSYVELNSTGRLNADAGLTLLTRVSLDNVNGEHALMSKYDSSAPPTSWFLSVHDGRIRFGVYDNLSGRGRVVQTNDAVITPRLASTIVARFNVTGQEMTVHVGGKQVAATPESDAVAEIQQIAKSAADIQLGTYTASGSYVGPTALMRGTLFEAAYFGWSLPLSYVTTLADE